MKKAEQLINMAVKEYMDCDTFDILVESFNNLREVIKKRAIEYLEFFPKGERGNLKNDIEEYIL